MANKVKARKHLLRKAITATFLAGTALSMGGGVIGTITPVKADQSRPKIRKIDRQNLLKVATEFSNSTNKEIAINHLKEAIKTADIETLYALLNGLDTADLEYGNNSEFMMYSRLFNTFEKEKGDKFHKDGINLGSLLIKEVKERIENEVKLKKEILNKNNEFLILNNKAKERKIELHALREDLKKEKLGLAKKEFELQTLKNLHSSLQDKHDAQTEQNKKLTEELKTARDAIQQVNKATMEALNKAEERRQNLKAAKDAAEKEHQEKVAMLNNQIKDLKAQLTKATDENNANGETNEGLNQKLKGLESELAMVNETLNNAQKALNDAEAEKEQLESKVLETKAQLEEANAKIESLSKENTTVKEQNKDLEEALATAKQEASKNPELLERIKQLETQLKDADGKLLSGNAAKKAIEAQLAATETELEDAKTKVDAINAKLKALEEQLQTTSEEKEKLESELAQMKKDHEDDVKKLEALVAEKDKLGKELRKQLDVLKEDSEKTKALSQEEKDKLLTEIADLQKALDEKMAMPEEHKNSEKRAEGQGMARNPEHKEQAPKKQGQLMPNNPTYALPHAGDMVNNPFFTAGAIAIMLSAGTLVMKPKKKEED